MSVILRAMGKGSRADPGPSVQQVWATANPAHAIQRVTAALVFNEEVPLFTVKRIADAVRAPAAEMGLKREEPLNSVLINMTAAGPSRSADNQHGTLFQQMQGASALHQLTISRELISLQSMAYTRWVGFREMIVPLIKAAAPILGQSAELRQVSLEYVDLFYAREPGRADAGLIINQKSRSINTQAFSRYEPFHSNSGWFETVGRERHLINADVASTDANGPFGLRRVVNIRTLEAVIADDSVSESAPISVDPDALAATLHALHLSLKARVGGILTDQAASMISLGI